MPNPAAPSSLRRFALPAALVLMFLLGGGSAQVPVEQVAAEWIGAGLLALALLHLSWADLVRGDRFAFALLAALAGLFALQLVPLPPALWTGMSGRAVFVNGDMLMFGRPLARPLSLDPDETRAALLFLVPAVAVWLLVRSRREFARRLVQAYLATLLVSLGWALAQVIAGPGQFHLYVNSHSDLPTGFFANRNHQAIAMVCGLPLAAALHRMNAAGSAVPAARWLFPMGAVAFAIGTLLTGSRTGGVLLVPGLAGALAIAYAAPRGQGRRSGQVRRWLPAGLGIAVVLAIIAAIRAGNAGGALGLVFSRSLLDADQRYEFWPSVAAMFGTYAPWGIGLGSFRRVYEVTEPDAILGPLFLNHAHCDWLEFAVETGWPGVALIGAFLAWLGLRVRQVRRIGLDAAPLGHAAALVVLLLLAHSLVDYPLRTVTLSAIMAAALALLARDRLTEVSA